jgi:putative DNA primase/helicase
MTIKKSNPRLEAALKYAAKGWPVFPCHFVTTKKTCSCGNDQCTNIGKHPTTFRGLNDATTDVAQIRKWWTLSPFANVAIATGSKSFDVLDIDPRHEGDETFARLENDYGEIPETIQQITGGSGTHILIKYSGKYHSQNNVTTGVDIKSDGGYIIAEPSNHLSGKEYAWDISHHPDETQLIDVTDWKGFEALQQYQSSTTNQSPLSSGTIAREGERNSKLTSVAGAMRRRGMDAEQIEKMLRVYNEDYCQPPLPQLEIERIASGMMRYEPEPEPPSTIDETVTVAEPRQQLAGLPFTDSGLRDRLIFRWGSTIMYVPEQGSWYIWDSTRWSIDKQNKIQELAIDTARNIRREELTGQLNKKGQDVAEAFSLASEANQKIKAMISLSQSHRDVVAGINDLDQHRYLFNCTNATIDLETGEMISPDPQHKLTQISRMKYNPEAICPQWEQFISEVLPDPEVANHVRKFLALSLSGDVSYESMMVWIGSGSNGKSVLLEIISHIFGDYLQTAPASTFLATRNDSVGNDLAMLRGSRLVTVSETNKGSMLDEAVVKRSVSGDATSARFLFREYFSYNPQYKLILATNSKPEISGGFATWRRLHLVEFGVQFGGDGNPKAKDKNELVAKLKDESSGILNWLIEGYRLLRSEGLEQPAAVENATREYREEQNPMLDFIETCCVEGEDVTVTSQDLREAYNSFSGEKISQVWFGRHMSDQGYRVSRIGSARLRAYKGITLNDEGKSFLRRSSTSFI